MAEHFQRSTLMLPYCGRLLIKLIDPVFSVNCVFLQQVKDFILNRVQKFYFKIVLVPTITEPTSRRERNLVV